MKQPGHAGFDALLEAAVDAIIVIDARGHVTAFNPSAERMFGYAAGEVIGHNVSMLMPEPYRTEHDGYIENYRRSGEAHIIGIGREVPARRKDGSTFPIYLAVGEIQDDGPDRFVGILRDITERKNAEEALRQREEQLGLVFESAPLGTATYDAEGAILSVNQAFSAMLGYEPQELLGRSFRDITHPGEVAASARRIRRAFNGELDTYRLEKRYLRKDGSVMYGMLHSGVVHDAQGKPMMLVAQVEDRTRQREAEEEVRRQRERLAHVGRISTIGEMAAGLAHEINQPLTAISNYARACRHMVAGGQSDAEELAAALDKIAAQAERAGEVIRRLRGMIRRREGEEADVDINELVREVAGLAEADARAYGLRLRLELTPELPPVHCDTVQIQQVLLNLVRNAIDAMLDDAPVDGAQTIRLRTLLDGGAIMVSVQDTGPGVSDQAASRMFTPFFTTKQEGMGLGLSISKNIIEAHGGELNHREATPAGTEFWFTLPAHG